MYWLILQSKTFPSMVQMFFHHRRSYCLSTHMILCVGSQLESVIEIIGFFLEHVDDFLSAKWWWRISYHSKEFADSVKASTRSFLQQFTLWTRVRQLLCLCVWCADNCAYSHPDTHRWPFTHTSVQPDIHPCTHPYILKIPHPNMHMRIQRLIHTFSATEFWRCQDVFQNSQWSLPLSIHFQLHQCPPEFSFRPLLASPSWPHLLSFTPSSTAGQGGCENSSRFVFYHAPCQLHCCAPNRPPYSLPSLAHFRHPPSTFQERSVPFKAIMLHPLQVDSGQLTNIIAQCLGRHSRQLISNGVLRFLFRLAMNQPPNCQSQIWLMRTNSMHFPDTCHPWFSIRPWRQVPASASPACRRVHPTPRNADRPRIHCSTDLTQLWVTRRHVPETCCSREHLHPLHNGYLRTHAQPQPHTLTQPTKIWAWESTDKCPSHQKM